MNGDSFVGSTAHGYAEGNIVIVRLKGRLSLVDVDRWDEFCTPLRVRFGRLAIVTIAEGVQIPTEDVRARSAQHAERARKYGEGVDVILLKGDGLWLAAARAVLTGIYLLSKRQGEHRVVPDVERAIDEVAERLPRDASVVRAVFAGFDAFEAGLAASTASPKKG
jgi:hypothetical protein